MEIFDEADSAVHGVSDISGVKDASLSCPEGEVECVPCVADGEEKTAMADTDEAKLEAEFEELIRGKYSDVYKRRTEGIIRKRLKSGKARPVTEAARGVDAEADSDLGEAEKEPSFVTEKAVLGTAGAIETALEAQNEGESSTEIKSAAIERTREQNRLRPLENGLGGSSGIVTRINVSALSGSDVISILNRVGAGERISFK